MRCYDCAWWGEGNGTGHPYDAGHVNYCNHPEIAGHQHPSYGACGEPTSMVMIEGFDKPQVLLTRGRFGCILFVQRKGLQSK